MKRYQCHKVVEAAKITRWSMGAIEVEGGERFAADTDLIRRLTNIDGPAYLVRYEDGYLSVSPAAVFEAGYDEVPPATPGCSPQDALAAGIEHHPV